MRSARLPTTHAQCRQSKPQQAQRARQRNFLHRDGRQLEPIVVAISRKAERASGVAQRIKTQKAHQRRQGHLVVNGVAINTQIKIAAQRTTARTKVERGFNQTHHAVTEVQRHRLVGTNAIGMRLVAVTGTAMPGRSATARTNKKTDGAAENVGREIVRTVRCTGEPDEFLSMRFVAARTGLEAAVDADSKSEWPLPARGNGNVAAAGADACQATGSSFRKAHD